LYPAVRECARLVAESPQKSPHLRIYIGEVCHAA
jgi:hypothetical protein